MDKTFKIGQKAGVKWQNLNVNPDQLKKGIKDESEHKDVVGQNKVKFAQIAMAHLKEMPDYYRRLDKMESKAKKSPNSIENRRKVAKNLIKQLK